MSTTAPADADCSVVPVLGAGQLVADIASPLNEVSR